MAEFGADRPLRKLKPEFHCLPRLWDNGPGPVMLSRDVPQPVSAIPQLRVGQRFRSLRTGLARGCSDSCSRSAIAAFRLETGIDTESHPNWRCPFSDLFTGTVARGTPPVRVVLPHRSGVGGGIAG